MQQKPVQEALSKQLGTFLLHLEKIAQSYYVLGNLDQALQLFQIGMQVIHIPEVTQRDQARFLLNYGNTLTIKTLFENAPVEKALSLLENAHQLAVTLADEQLIADTLDGIGYAHYISASSKRDGDPHMFLAYFQEALERRKALHDDRGISESLFHLGLTNDVLGQKEAARSFYTQALQIAQQQNYPLEASYVLRHIGFHEQMQGNLSQAQQYFTESLHLRTQIDMHPLLPFSYVALSDVYLAQGNMKLASFTCQKALDLARKMDIKRVLIFSLFNSGCICQEKHEEEQARDYFEQAYNMAKSIDLDYAIQFASSALQSLSTNPKTE
jgi:tetratricopeptide (TPR) repeat protein